MRVNRIEEEVSDVQWLQPAIIATISNTVILALVYLYLYLKEDDKSLLLFCISWSLYSLRFVFMLFYIYFDKTPLLLVNQALVIISSHLLLVSFNTWLRKTPSPVFWNIATLISLGLVIGAGFDSYLFTGYIILVFLYVGVLYIAIGVSLLRSSQRSMSGIKIVAFTLILWGLHKMDYPFLRPLDWFAPWGYLIGAVAAVITAIGMILIYFETTKLRLNGLLREKETLMREVHHRVKNNLSVLHSLLKYNLSSVNDPSIKKILKKLEDTIFAFALIHTLLHKSDSVEQIDFIEYLREFSGHLVESYGESFDMLSFDSNLKSLIINIDYAKSLGLIVNELLTNTLKYAFPDDRNKRIHVNIVAIKASSYMLEIRDNGVGFPKGIDMDSPKMSGLYLVRMLCDEIDGKFELESVEGTKAQIFFTV